jgi:hypothetical protein
MPNPEPLSWPLPEALRRYARLPSQPSLRRLLIGLLIASSLFLSSPYLSLWRLNQTSVNGPTAALEQLVDIDAVRDQIQQRLNKEHTSAIGEVSDAFVQWIQSSLRRHGSSALQQEVTLGWMRQLLLDHAQGRDGFWPNIRYAFFSSPNRFRVEIMAPTTSAAAAAGAEANDNAAQLEPLMPLQLLLARTWLSWRVIAAYY